MSEERTQYTVHPDVAIRLEVAERHIKHLESTNDGLTMVMGRHRETMREQAERIAELEATVLRQMETIARLEQDNKRLRHLDAMPVDALRRYVDKTDRVKNETYSRQYLYEDFLDDREAIDIWLATLDGDA